MLHCIVILFFLPVAIGYTSCTVGDFAGVGNPSSYGTQLDTKSEIGFVVRLDDYKFQCCGVITGWKVYVAQSGDLELQVWRKQGTEELLIGENVVQVTQGFGGNEMEFTIDATEQITVVPDDAIGWRTTGLEVITFYKTTTLDHLIFFDESMHDVPIGHTHTFPKDAKDKLYAVKAMVGPGSPPQFLNLPATINLSDLTLEGFIIFTPNISDVNTHDTHWYTATQSAYFSINNVTGAVSVASQLIPSVFKLSIMVTDVCGFQDLQELTIVVTGTNYSPQFGNMPGTGHIHEETKIESNLHTFTVTDSEPMTCSFTYSGMDDDLFILKFKNSTTDVTTYTYEYGLYLKASANLSYSVRTSYEVIINCTDGQLWSSSTVYVYVVANVAPVFTNLPGSTSVSARSVIVGIPFYDVIATDADSIHLTYTMSWDSCPFNISEGGNVFATNVLVTLKNGVFDLTVFVSDGKLSSGPAVLTILVTDRNTPPAITGIPTLLKVLENTQPMTSLLTFYTTDDDANDVLTCSFEVEPTSGISLFGLNTSSRSLIINQNVAIDFESVQYTMFNITFTVSDSIDFTSASMLLTIVDINDPPLFTSHTAYITVNESQGFTRIGNIPNYYDQDVNDTVSYRITGGTGSGYITISNTSGELYFIIDYDLDILLPNLLTVNVEIIDSGGLTDSCIVYITILDVNDNPPSFNETQYYFTVEPNAPEGSVVGTVSAYDIDSGNNAKINLGVKTPDDTYFRISQHGEIISLVPMSNFTDSSVILYTVTARDQGTPSLSSEVNVYIVIKGVVTSSNISIPNTYMTVATESGNEPPLYETIDGKILICFSTLSLLLLLILIACMVHQNRKKPVNNQDSPRERVPKPLPTLTRMKSSTLLLQDTDYLKPGTDRNDHLPIRPAMSQKHFASTAPTSLTIQSRPSILKTVREIDSQSATSTYKSTGRGSYPRILRLDGVHELGKQMKSERSSLQF